MTDDEVLLHAALARIEERLTKIEERLAKIEVDPAAQAELLRQIALGLGIRP